MNHQLEYLASFGDPLESLDVDAFVDLDDTLIDGDDWEDEQP